MRISESRYKVWCLDQIPFSGLPDDLRSLRLGHAKDLWVKFNNSYVLRELVSRDPNRNQVVSLYLLGHTRDDLPAVNEMLTLVVFKPRIGQPRSDLSPTILIGRAVLAIKCKEFGTHVIKRVVDEYIKSHRPEYMITSFRKTRLFDSVYIDVFRYLTPEDTDESYLPFLQSHATAIEKIDRTIDLYCTTGNVPYVKNSITY